MENFNINRLYLLMKKDILENYKNILLAYFSVIGLVLIFLIIDASKTNAHLWVDFNNMFQLSILFVGVSIAGLSFTNFRTKELTTSYLTLPATNIEKVASQIILASFGVIISYTIVFYISHFLFIGIGEMFYTIEIGTFNPFDASNIKTIKGLIIAQSVFIAGASYFNKLAVFKTGGTVFIIWLVFFIVSSLLLNSTIENIPSNIGLNIDFGISKSNINISAANIIESKDLWAGSILRIFFTYLLAPIFWTITYFNVKEKEV